MLYTAKLEGVHQGSHKRLSSKCRTLKASIQLPRVTSAAKSQHVTDYILVARYSRKSCNILYRSPEFDQPFQVKVH